MGFGRGGARGQAWPGTGGVQGLPVNRACRTAKTSLAVFAGGVDVAADTEAVLGGVVAGQPAGDLLLGLIRAQSGLADVVRGPHAGVGGEPEDVGFAVAAEFEHVPAGMLFRAVPGAGDAGHVGQGDGDRAAELLLEGLADGGGDRVQAVAAGLVAGVDQRAEGFLRLAGPDRAGVGFRAVLQVTEYVGDAGLVAGDVLPCRVEVVAVPVGDRDAGEVRRGSRSPSWCPGTGCRGGTASTSR